MTSPVRPDEGQSRSFDGVGEIGVLGKETVARVDAVGARRAGRGQDGIDVQIGFGGGRGPDVYRGVSELDRERVSVGVAVGLHGSDAQFARGTDDPYRDLATIGNEEGADRCHLRGVTSLRMPMGSKSWMVVPSTTMTR